MDVCCSDCKHLLSLDLFHPRQSRAADSSCDYTISSLHVRAAYEHLTDAERDLPKADDIFRRGAEHVIHNLGLFEGHSEDENVGLQEEGHGETESAESGPSEATPQSKEIVLRRQVLLANYWVFAVIHVTRIAN